MKKRRKKYKSVITGRIIKSLHKLSVAVLIMAFFAPITVMRGTNASFFDEEKSTGNSIKAGTLDGKATQTSFSYTTGEAPMEPGDVITQDVNFENVGSLPFQYNVKYLEVGGGDLCDALLLTAKKDSTVIYNKLPLKDFDSGDIIPPVPPVETNSLILDPTKSDDWQFIFELPGDSAQTLENQTCDFNFKFIAWQTDFVDNPMGFWDEELVDPGTDGIEIETGEWQNPGDVVINEIMWMGNGGNDSDEWIELRNMTDEEIDISNWKIVHGGAGVTGHIQIPHGYSIKPNGYFLLTAKKWNETAIKLESDLAKDEGYTHVAGGMSLLNSGEDLILQNKNGVTIDTAWKTSAWPAGCDDKNGVCEDLYQSMERENIPGDGTQSSSWHTCVSSNCNDGTYWDTADGNNYGTPGSANLSPVVMNEFVPNPAGSDREWVELYNISEEKVNVSGWYLENGKGDKKTIDEDTEIAGGERMVVYLEKGFLDNDKDTLSFYNAEGTLEDIYKYENAGTFPQGKSFARFPDGVGIWIDPEATPGEENKLNKKEKRDFRFLAYEECFDGEKLAKNKKATVCAPVFLEFLGMIKNADDKTIDDEILIDILEMKKEKEKEKLTEMLKDAEKLIADQKALADTEEPGDAPDNANDTGTENPVNNSNGEGNGEGNNLITEPIIKEENNNPIATNDEQQN